MSTKIHELKGAPINTKIITAKVPPPLAEKVDEIATRLKRSRAWVLTQALTAWIDREEEKRRRTLEVIADVKAGKANNVAFVSAKLSRMVDGKRRSKKKIESPVDEMRASYRREDFAALERGKFHAEILKVQYGAGHVTPAGVNIFADLGFPPDEAERFLKESKRIIAQTRAAKAKKTAPTREFGQTIAERTDRDAALARASGAEATACKDSSPAENLVRQIRKSVRKK